MINRLYEKNKFLYNSLWLFITAAIVFLDQLTKHIVVKNMQLYDETTVVDGLFKLYYVRNDGAGLGLLSNARWVFITFTFIVIAVAIVALFVNYFKNSLAFFSVIFILGGGIGNMIDRLMLGEVVDFFQFQIKFFDFIFNVADVFVTFGVIMFVVYFLAFYDKERENIADE